VLPPGADLRMRPRLFRGYGSGKPKGLLPLARDVTVRGAPGGPPPGVDWGLMDGVMAIRAGTTLTFRGVAVSNMRCGR
jgi:hypothetical protein